MYSFEHSIEGNLNLKKVWALYSDVSRWKEWDNDVESVILQGEFVKGSAGIINLIDGKSMPFILDRVTIKSEFTTVSRLGALVVTFGHSFTSEYILHTVTIDGGEDKQMESMGKGISMNISASMERLIMLAKE